MRLILAVVVVLMFVPTVASGSDWEGQLAYGPATTVSLFDGPHLSDLRVDADGIVRAGSISDYEIRPGFVLSYLFSKGGGAFGVGPMFVTDVEIGGDKAAAFGSIGAGILFAFRSKGDNGSFNGFGVGVAYTLSTGVKTLRSDFRHEELAPAAELQFVGKTRSSIAVVATWSFGKTPTTL
ncbi:MAG: hypothetical protein F4X59_13660 [Holophagales bacterium]|nr:hypothetical protein [Holophagales bacterium]MYC11160.1 hypothetical protein [Holophagales bacterium]